MLLLESVVTSVVCCGTIVLIQLALANILSNYIIQGKWDPTPERTKKKCKLLELLKLPYWNIRLSKCPCCLLSMKDRVIDVPLSNNSNLNSNTAVLC